MSYLESQGLEEKLDRDKEQLLSVVAFSTNKRAVETLEKFFKKKGIECFFFYESFISVPLGLKMDIKEQELKATAPFLRRYIELPGIRFIPDIDAVKKLNKSVKFQDLLDNLPFIPKTQESLKKIADENLQRINLVEEEAIFGSGLFPLWEDIVTGGKEIEVKKKHKDDFPYSKPFVWGDDEKIKNIVGYRGEFPKAYLKGEYLQDILKSKNRLPLLVEYLVSDFQFVLSRVEKVKYLCMSISSKDLFYGYAWLFWSGGKEVVEEDLIKVMGQLIKENYLPVMILFENAWEEKILKENIKKGLDILWNRGKRNIIDIVNGNNKIIYTLNLVFLKEQGEFNDELEKGLHQLWERRWEVWKRTKDTKELGNTLVFNKFFISSKEMIKILKSTIRLNHVKKMNFLPSALVVGGPGAGKNAISQLIKIFSTEYFESPLYTINVASLKPAPIGPSLMLGTEVSINSKYPEKKGIDANLVGIFEKIWKEVREKKNKVVERKNNVEYAIERDGNKYKFYKNNSQFFETCFSGDNVKKKSVAQQIQEELKRQGSTEEEKRIFNKLFNELVLVKAVVVLDELNSLDTDTQGALLRLLENSELIPIGGIKPVTPKEEIDFLIIGAMNEDPERLTKEKIFSQLSREKIFGGIVGEILYEHFRNIRRLREDLYYRLIRGGKIVLPPLNKRREDIPILFYVFCITEVESKDVKLYIPLDVLEILTLSHLDWGGNVRQLQSLVHVVVTYASQDEKNNRVIINEKHLRQGLKDIGMNEDGKGQ